MELALGEYAVEDVVDTVKRSLRSLAAEKGLEFVAAAPAGHPARPRGRQAHHPVPHEPRRERAEVHARRVGWRSGWSSRARHSSTGSRTPGSASPRTRSRHIFEEFRQVGRRPSPGSSAGPGWGSASRSGSSSCTAGGSGSRARWARARPSSSRSRSGSGGRPRMSEKTDPLHRGQRVQPQDRPGPAGPHVLSSDRGRRRRGRRGHRAAGGAGAHHHGHPAAPSCRAWTPPAGSAPTRGRLTSPSS